MSDKPQGKEEKHCYSCIHWRPTEEWHYSSPRGSWAECVLAQKDRERLRVKGSMYTHEDFGCTEHETSA